MVVIATAELAVNRSKYMFDNEIVLEHDTLQKVYTKLIEALNEVRIQKNTASTSSELWNGKSHNTCIGQVKAKSVVVEYDDIEFFDWSLNNSSSYFWS